LDRNDALTLLPRMIEGGDVYDDGMNKELVFSYHTMYIGLFVEAYNLFRRAWLREPSCRPITIARKC
jgi:hypothetical protein